MQRVPDPISELDPIVVLFSVALIDILERPTYFNRQAATRSLNLILVSSIVSLAEDPRASAKAVKLFSKTPELAGVAPSAQAIYE